ncbi:hypothetical protein AMAG_13182 [Allomyces macrogynus ATCC 38327]|uniref:UNC93-like protein MFSD11 n=1 Tax=Allomyces macrogynus (strain ATCC 38327) TaxID=578462 RepID=A0A0L0SZT6_ALLM3|nr:hypothetical protein AMAG_13182 [Allomyces macrogynus ATCC 38327]|eukprot:KNE68007.1 hypothetical protein AMAG_13182 [Allomyces macrogynus ATCC 38327]
MVQTDVPLIQTTQRNDTLGSVLASASPIETRPNSPNGSVDGPFSNTTAPWHPLAKDTEVEAHKDKIEECGNEVESLAPEVTRAKERSAMLRVAWLGFGFLCILTAINVASTNVTVLYPDQGFNSLATLYFCFIIGSLLAPIFTARFPPWLIFIAAGCFYTVFDASLNWGVVPMFIFSALIGIAAGPLWVAEGSYVTATAKASGVPIGKLTSIFLTFFTANMTVGNVISLALQRLGVSRATMLYVMAGISGLGSLCLAFVPTPPRSATLASASAAAETSLLTKVKAIGKLLTRRPMAALIPLILWNGAVNTLAFANFPTFLPDALLDARPETLPLMFIAYGAFAALGSPLFGRAYDRAGLRPLMVLVALISTAMFAMTYVVILYLPTLLPLRADGSLDVDAHYGTIVAILVLAGGFLGALDSITTGTMNFVQSAWFPDGAETATAFAASRVVMCSGFVLLALVSNTGVWQVVLALNHALMVVTLACMAWLIWCTPYGLAPREMRSVLQSIMMAVATEDEIDGAGDMETKKSPVMGPSVPASPYADDAPLMVAAGAKDD